MPSQRPRQGRARALAEPQPEFLSIVPFTGEVKEPRYRLKALEAEAQAQQICMDTRDFREAYEAFVAKRKPEFKGD